MAQAQVSDLLDLSGTVRFLDSWTILKPVAFCGHDGGNINLDSC